MKTKIAKLSAVEPALSPLVPQPYTLSETVLRALETARRRMTKESP